MNIKELIKWHEKHKSLTFKVNDIITYEGNNDNYIHHDEYIILYINPYKDTYKEGYKYNIIGIKYTEEIGVYEDDMKDFTHFPNDALLGRALNEVDNDDTTDFLVYINIQIINMLVILIKMEI